MNKFCCLLVSTVHIIMQFLQGYKELEKMDYTHLMSIRGDNYCAIRSTLFQTFCVRDFNVCSFLANMKPPVEAKEVNNNTNKLLIRLCSLCFLFL